MARRARFVLPAVSLTRLTSATVRAVVIPRPRCLAPFPLITSQGEVDPIFQDGADLDLGLIESQTLDGHTQELVGYRPTMHVWVRSCPSAKQPARLMPLRQPDSCPSVKRSARPSPLPASKPDTSCGARARR